MATRITIFDVSEHNGKIGLSIRERRCSVCGENIPGCFEFHCPNCGERFDDMLHDYQPKES